MYTHQVLSVTAQLHSGRLVCPLTKQRLIPRDGHLVTHDGILSYAVQEGVPILLPDAERRSVYREQQAGAMHAEYASASNSWRRAVRWLSCLGGDYRTAASQSAFEAVVATQPPDALCLSVGGGPQRVHANLVNLNIDTFPNVDVVGDAYRLPYADFSVDAIHCEAVLEHLELPDHAVTEMFRVLRYGGQAFAATPFLQPFHAYPNHFQNFTTIGHTRLFERAGFKIVSAGTCVGPTFALSELLTVYLRTFVPTWFLSRSLAALARLALLPFRPLDRLLQRSRDAHLLASSVYTHAVKL